MKAISIFVLAFFFMPVSRALAEPENPQLTGAIPPSTGGEFTITHHTIDAGYAEISGGEFTLRGIVGQAEAGISEGNSTVFISGFISTSVPLESSFIFRDGFEGN